MSLVKEFDFDDLKVSEAVSGTGNISTTNHTFNSIDTVKYYSTVTNTSEKTFTYTLNSEKLYDYIFSSNDMITLSFNVYLNIFNTQSDIFKIKINDNVIFYFSGNQSLTNEKFTINYLFKSDDLTSILGGEDPSLNLIFDGIDSGQSEYVLLDKNFQLYAIYKPEFSSITVSNRIIRDLALNDSFNASSKTIANANACEIKGLSTTSSGEVTFNLKNKLLDNKPVSLFFNLNVDGLSSFVVELQDTLRIKVSNGPKISLTESETSMLQTEFIATTENEAISTWYANYVKEGSNGSTSLTNSSTGFEYNSDTNGPYFLVNSSSINVTLQNYPNQTYIDNMDTTSGAVLCYEIWCYYSGDDGTISSNRGWLMGVETGYGPFIVLTDNRIGGIGTTPGATDNDTYSSLTNPGYITDDANKGQLLHIVGYWEQTSSDPNSNHKRGVYINGTHYPQETTTQSGETGKPEFDGINKNFQVGGRDTPAHTALGVRIYSFRIWHGDIRSKVSTLYDAGPHASVITNYRDILELNSSNNDELKTLFYTQTENYDSSNNFNVKFSLTGDNIGTSHYVYFEDMFTYIPEAINFFDASGINPSGTITLEPSLLINSNDYVGSIELFNSLQLPDNYLLCDGSVITKSDNDGNYYAPLIDFLNGNTTGNSCYLPNFHEKYSLGVNSGISNYNSSTSNHIGKNQLDINYFPTHNHSANASNATMNAYNIVVNKTGMNGIVLGQVSAAGESGSGSRGQNQYKETRHNHTIQDDYKKTYNNPVTNIEITTNYNITSQTNNTYITQNSSNIHQDTVDLQLISYKLYFGIRFK